MHGGTVHRRVASGDTDYQRHLLGPVGAHADDHESGERPRPHALPTRDIHGDVPALFDVRDPQARADQRRLEREATLDQEHHEVVPPAAQDVLRLLYQLAVLIDAVLRNVGPQVRARRRNHGLRSPGFGDLKDRAGFGIPYAELQEVERVLSRKYDKVGLHETGGQPACRSRMIVVADASTNLARVGLGYTQFLFHGSSTLPFLAIE